MSLINQMLKDLEKRTHSSMGQEAIIPGIPVTVFSHYRTASKKIGLIVAISLIGLMLALIGQKILFAHHPVSVLTHSTVSASIQPQISTSNTLTTSSIVPPLHLTPAILTAITMQLKEEKTFLRLLLSQNVLYRVSMNQKNQLIITLENARLVASLPPIKTMNSAIQDIQMINHRNGDLQILLSLKAGAELSHLELNETGQFPELQLDLISHASTASQANLIPKNTMVEEQTGSIIKLRTDVSINDKYQEALQLSTQGHSHEAIAILTDILARDPEYAPARESLASLFIAQGSPIKAQQVIKVGLQQRPFYPAYVELKAKMLVNEGKIKQALYLLQLAPPALTTDPMYHAFIAALYQREGQPAFAEKLYEQLLSLQPNNATWWMGLGVALESMGKSTLAIEAYLKASNNDHLSPELKIYAETRVHHLDEMR